MSPRKKMQDYRSKPHFIGDVISILNQRAPLSTAEEWDNVGLLLGDPKEKLTGVLVCIDLTSEAIEKAKRNNCNLIINHHPCIFPKGRGLSRISVGSVVYEALRKGISVAAYHTNFDICALEVSQSLCKNLGVKPLGRFSEGSKNLTNLIARNPLPSIPTGYGFWGELTSPRPFSDLAKGVKSLFNINGFWITCPVPSHVKRIGFVAGKGASFIDAAADANCDLFITGEAGYHAALAGSRRGVAVMELGHRESEKFFVETIKHWLSKLDLCCVEFSSPTQQIWLGGKK